MHEVLILMNGAMVVRDRRGAIPYSQGCSSSESLRSP
jgi:hypothetical protein